MGVSFEVAKAKIVTPDRSHRAKFLHLRASTACPLCGAVVNRKDLKSSPTDCPAGIAHVRMAGIFGTDVGKISSGAATRDKRPLPATSNWSAIIFRVC